MTAGRETNFERPRFQRMIEDIEAEKSTVCCNEDLSRLSRNYIIVGLVLYFPSHNVRYIAIIRRRCRQRKR